jgi:hypothetical protein
LHLTFCCLFLGWRCEYKYTAAANEDDPDKIRIPYCTTLTVHITGSIVIML